MPKSQIITQKIIEIRGHKVLLDFDLAELYNTETRILKQAVRRNSSRFPEDFMFELTEVEINNLVSQSVIPSKSKLGGVQVPSLLQNKA
ncbi:ORF6N domain-containing protein [Flavobacterium sp.]|uniref:ORF6N domain-containing protein n=1 Tax=Flavobacterium sp. TaxID=239 RepID=UPI000B1F3237|nr:ORF6N domain-containing protein [Flavobacterium sp.]